MSFKETATAVVEVDGKQAENELAELKKQARDTAAELKKMKLEKDPGYAEKKREFDALQRQIDSTRKSTFDLNGTMKNLSGATMKELQRAKNQLSFSLRNSRRDTAEARAEWARKSKQLQQVNAEMSRVNKEMGNVRKTHQSGFLGQIKMGWLAVAGAVTMAFMQVRSFLQARDQQLKSNIMLQNALNGEEAAYRRLIRFASEMQDKRGISDDVVNQHSAFLALQGRNEQQIMNTIKAATELSVVMGVSLQTAIQNLDATFEGNIGRLGRLDTAFNSLTKEQLANGAAVDLILQKYGGQAESVFRQGLGPLNAYKNAWGDLQKTLGAILINTITPLFSNLARMINNMNTSLENMLKTSTEKFAEQLEKVGELEFGIRPLLDRYDDLTSKATLSTQEQSELNEIIATIARTMPSAISQFNEYGEAIAISTERAREFIDIEIDRLKVVNSKAIEETTRALQIRQNRVQNSADLLRQIEQRGTFDIISYHQTKHGTITEMTRDATQQEVAEQISKHQQLVSDLRGHQAQLAHLNGDFLKQEQTRREEESRRRREEEEKRAEYFKIPLMELKKLADEGDQLAVRIYEQRKNEKDEVKQAINAYNELTAAITKSRAELAHMVTVGEFSAAKLKQASIDSMEAQKLVLDGIIRNGGDLYAFIDELTDADIALLEERAAQAEQFFDLFGKQSDKYVAKREQQRMAEAQAEADRAINELEKQEWVNQQKIRMAQETSQAIAAITDAALMHSFNLFSQHMHARADKELTALYDRRDKELQNEELTAEERDKINEKYRKQEAKLRQETWKKQQKADIIQSLINTSIAVGRALAAPPGFPFNAPSVYMAGVLGALQTAAIAAQPVPQFARGRYNVIGQDDGRTYNVPYIGKARTGVVRGPALVSERGDELIIDSPTHRNLQINAPEIIRGIMHYRVPQYDKGRYTPVERPSRPLSPSGSADTAPMPRTVDEEVIRDMIAALKMVYNRFAEPIPARLSLFELDQMQDKRSLVESETSF
jgi:hypothetical protein